MAREVSQDDNSNVSNVLNDLNQPNQSEVGQSQGSHQSRFNNLQQGTISGSRLHQTQSQKDPTQNQSQLQANNSQVSRLSQKVLEEAQQTQKSRKSKAPSLKEAKTVQTKTKLVDLKNYTEENYIFVIKEYRKLRVKFPQATEQIFFQIMNVDVRFVDVDLLLQKSQGSIRLWSFIINYIIKLNFFDDEKHQKPYYQYYVIRDQNTKLDYLEYKDSPEFQNALMQKVFNTEDHSSILLLLKRLKKYLIIFYSIKTGETTLVDFAYHEKSLMSSQDIMFIGKKIISEKFNYKIKEEKVTGLLLPIQDVGSSDQSELMFGFLKRLIEGVSPELIRMNKLDVMHYKKRLEYLIIQTGFNDLQRIYEEERELENQKDQERVLAFQRIKQRDYLQNQHYQNPFEDVKREKIRLDSPKNPDDIQDQVLILQKRLDYLKQKQQNNDVFAEFIQSNVDQRKTVLDVEVDKELDELDKLLLMQDDVKQKMIFSKQTQFKGLQNLYELMDGKFHDKLFQGLGLPKLNKEDNEIKQREEVLRNLREHNMKQMISPLLNVKQETLPGMFLPPPSMNHPDPKKAVLAFRYSIQITRHSIINLRNHVVDESVINFYLQFLEEYNDQTTTIQSRRNSEMRLTFLNTRLYNDIYRYIQKQISFLSSQKLGNKELVDFSYDKKYLQNFDKIIVPIQAGLQHEFQLVLIDVSNFKVIHYHLCELPMNIPQGQYQQASLAWNFALDSEQDSQDVRRRKQQDIVLQQILYWIKCQANNFDLKQYADLRLWKVRLERNIQMKSVKATSLYMLLLCSLLANGFNSQFYESRLLNCISSLPSIIEYVICSCGIGMKQINQSVMQYFKNEMNKLIQSLQ